MKERGWKFWTVLEATTRILSVSLQKKLGLSFWSNIAQCMFSAFVIGMVQAIVGTIVLALGRKKIVVKKSHIVGSFLFGAFAALATVLGFTVFRLGGEVSVTTFIYTLAIIPGALVDRIFFAHRLCIRQWMGLGLGIFAGYAILGWPNLSQLLKLPPYILIALSITVIIALNQGITQWIKEVNPFFKNALGGSTSAGLVLLFLETDALSWGPALKTTAIYSVVIGVIVVAMWAFNVLSYKEGARIALKKLTMNGVYLTMAMFVGRIFFGESISFDKIIGISLYLLAFVLGKFTPQLGHPVIIL